MFLGVGLALSIVVVSGWLFVRANRTPVTGVAQTTQAGDLHVTMQLDDTAIGARVIDLLVKDATGRMVDVNAARLRFAMTEMDMGKSEVDAQRVKTGHFQARGQFFTMAGTWAVEATLLRDGQTPLLAPFRLAIAAPGEASGPVNPYQVNGQSIQAGQKLYLANCVPCHGASGKGDGPAGIGLNPRPGDFTQHMIPGKHTDGQAFLWIKNGFPNSAMPAWGTRLTDEQIWQLVGFLRTFGQSTAQAQPTAQANLASPTQQTVPAQVPLAQEPLPP